MANHRIALLSDMQGNGAATDTVLADIDTAQADEMICLGEGLLYHFAGDIEIGGRPVQEPA